MRESGGQRKPRVAGLSYSPRASESRPAIADRAISPFLSGLLRSLSVLQWLVPLLLARLRLRQTCYVITVGAHSAKFSVLSRLAATLGSRPSQRALSSGTVRPPVIYDQWKVHELGVEIVWTITRDAYIKPVQITLIPLVRTVLYLVRYIFCKIFTWLTLWNTFLVSREYLEDILLINRSFYKYFLWPVGPTLP